MFKVDIFKFPADKWPVLVSDNETQLVDKSLIFLKNET